MIVFVAAFLIYRSNDGFVYTYDSAPTSLFVLNALEHHTLAFDDFRNGYVANAGASYVFTEAPNGHLEPIFPIGVALLTAPIYAVAYAVGSVHGPFPEVSSDAFALARLVYEKLASNIVGACCASLFFLCARRFAPVPQALLATAAFSIGSEMWTVGSLALWQHGSIALVLLAMILALTSAPPETLSARALFLAGVCAGFLPVVRPTALAFSLAGLAFALMYGRKKRPAFVFGAVVGALPGIAWNVGVFHALVGGYAVNEGSYTYSLEQAFRSLTGLFFSPNRGLFIFTPFVVFSIGGLFGLARERTSQSRLLQMLCVSALAIVVNYAFFQRWEGGSTYGPRYLTELMPVAALLLLFVLPIELRKARLLQRFVAATACIAVALSIGVQVAGANGEPKMNWSGVPLDLSLDPSRLWRVDDSEIERDARATVHLWTANPTFPNAYVTRFDAAIANVAIDADGAKSTVSSLDVAPGSSLILKATVANTGSVPLYGYTTGIYFGQARVRVRIMDATDALVASSYLYLDGSPEPGLTARAIGSVAFPTAPGRYTMLFDIDGFQDARIGGRHVALRSLPLRVGAK